MGLDMFAVRRIYTKQWDHQKPEQRYTVKVDYGGEPAHGIHSERILAVEEEVMYWRKANHIHAWFVEHVQGGVDNCASYYVSMENLAKLAEVCREVRESSKLVEGMVFAGKSWNSEKKGWDEHREPGLLIEDPAVAKKLLPTREGFFFGDCEHGENYLDDVKQTEVWALSMLAEHQIGVPGEIYYSSSW